MTRCVFASACDHAEPLSFQYSPFINRVCFCTLIYQDQGPGVRVELIWPGDKGRSTKLKRFLELGFQISKLPSSINGSCRSLIDVMMSAVSVIRLLRFSLIP